jgi:hypothetical protein
MATVLSEGVDQIMRNAAAGRSESSSDAQPLSMTVETPPDGERGIRNTEVKALRRASSAIMAVATLALAGCGAGATHTVTQTSTERQAAAAPVIAPAPAAPSRAAFIARADTICRQVDAKTDPLETRVAAITDLSTGAPLIAEAAVDAQRGLAALRSLPEPAAGRALLAKVWAAADREVVDVENTGQAAGEGDAQGVQSAQSAAETAHALYQGLAQGYGFKLCGQGGD